MVLIDLFKTQKGKIMLCLGCVLLFIIMFVLLKPLPEVKSKQEASTSTPKIVSIVPIYAVKTLDKKIAISFDAGWGAAETPKILAILKIYKIKTTFFLVNTWLKKYPDMAKRISVEGHEIGMHSTTHRDFTKLTDDQIKQELYLNHEMIKQICDYDAKIFRPPFGYYNKRVMLTVGNMGYITVKWSIDSLDWEGLSAKVINERVLKHIKPGAIVLFHNSGKNTAKAIETIIPKLLQQGYKIIPVSELIYKDNFRVNRLGLQIKKVVLIEYKPKTTCL